MGTWIEIRCEKGYTPSGYLESQKCHSAINHGPMGMARDDQQSILDLVRRLTRRAIDSGWVRKRCGWVCPHCAPLMKDEQ